MQKEHGQVTGIIWCGPEDLAVYQLVKQYAEKQSFLNFKNKLATGLK